MTCHILPDMALHLRDIFKSLRLVHAEQAERDYAGTLTNLFKDIATAVDENEQFIAGTFGPEATVEATLGLQQVLTTCQPSPSPAQPLPVNSAEGTGLLNQNAW